MAQPETQPDMEKQDDPHPEIAPEDDSAMADALAAASEAMNQKDAEIPPEEEALAVIEGLQAQVETLKDQMLRATAEAENVRRRAQRDVEDANKFGTSSFARDLIPVVENMYRAAVSIPEEARDADPNLKNLATGVDMVLRELMGVFEKRGIQRISPENQKFDHNVHQAVSQVETNEIEPGTVMQVLQAGYMLHDRLLQPAMVIVAKGAMGVDGEPVSVDTQA